MSLFESLFSKLTPADKTALTAALGWLTSIEREYAKSNRQDETREDEQSSTPTEYSSIDWSVLND